jgi:hypothetical protein
MGDAVDETDPDHPTLHVCGTRACIAGTAIIESATEEQISKTLLNARDRDGDFNDYLFIEHLGFLVAGDSNPGTAGRILLGLDPSEAKRLFHSDWEPREDLTVAQALELLADGATAAEISLFAEYDDDYDVDDQEAITAYFEHNETESAEITRTELGQ